MSTFTDAIAEVLATVTPGVRPTAPKDSDFGSDVSCWDDTDSVFTELDPDDPLLVAQAAYRALKTIPGELPDLDVPDWGVGLQQYLRRAATPTQIAAIPGIVQSRLMALDDRILSLAASPLTVEAGGRYGLTLRGMTARGPFDLTVSASPFDVLLKAMAGP